MGAFRCSDFLLLSLSTEPVTKLNVLLFSIYTEQGLIFSNFLVFHNSPIALP